VKGAVVSRSWCGLTTSDMQVPSHPSGQRTSAGDPGFGMTNKKELARIMSARLVEDLEVFAWLEADGFAGGDGDFGAGAGVAAYAGLAGLDGEDAEAAEFDAIGSAEGLLHGLEDGVDGGFSLGAGKAGALNNALDEILLDQCEVAFLCRVVRSIACFGLM
jgi:hypothetical protein